MASYFEIHVTVKAERGGFDYDKNWDRFKDACKLIKAKPLCIINWWPLAGCTEDWITSSEVKTESVTKAIDVLKEHYFNLIDQRFQVVRGKIEVSPNHKMVPRGKSSIGHYYETHLKYTNFKYAQDVGLPMSQISGQLNVIGTYRRYQISQEAFRKELGKFCHNPAEQEIEYCWYDTNIAHDDPWLKAYERKY